MIKQKINNNETIRIIRPFFTKKNEPAYIVGGFLRDCLTDTNKKYSDIDIVTEKGHAKNLSIELSDSINGYFIELDDINKIYDGMLSICTARGHLSEEKMLQLIKKTTENRNPYTTIVQADGFPMSGGKDDYKTTLQAVATAEIVQNSKLPVYIMLSGGTNSKTSELAQMCGINYNGIAIGSFARKIVSRYIEREDFLRNKYVFNEAVSIAKNLIQTL